MATYVNNLRLKEITTGDESGTWGTSTNTNLELIADAFGSGTEAIVTNADTHTTEIANGAADEGRAIYMKYTGTLDSVCTITLAPDTVNKFWIIENATAGSQDIRIKQGSGGGAYVTIGNGKVAAVFTDGLGSGAIVYDAFADLELSSTLTVAGAASLASTLAVTGASTLTGALTANGGAIFNEGSADVDFRIESDGNANMFFVDGGNNKIGIGANDPDCLLHIKGADVRAADSSSTLVLEGATGSASNAGVNILSTGTGNILFGDAGNSGIGKITYTHSSNALTVATNDAAALTIDSSQNVLVELATAEALYTLTPKLQVETTGGDAGLSAWRNTNDAGGAYLFLGSSRGTSLNSDTIVQDDDALGSIMFVAADGVDRVSAAASIIANIDGTPGADDTPGRLQFNTTADGAQGPTTRMKILSDGKIDIPGTVGIGTTASARALNVLQATSAEETAVFAHSHGTNVAGCLVNFTGGTITNRTKYFFRGMDTSGTKMSLWSDGGATFAGDVNFGGNLIIGGTGSANELDDYEEGAWTPLIDGSGGVSSQTYTTQAGRYQRVGQVVHCQCVVKLNGKGTITGYARVSGLPITPNAVPNYNVAATSIAQASISDGHLFYAQQYAGNPFCYLYESDISEDEGLTQVTTSVINDDTEIVLSLTYRTNA